MKETAAYSAGMRREIFLFPLNTVLYPGGVLALKIFEQRYLEMTKACLRDNLPFGVCLISEGREVGLPATPQDVGCLATIEQWDMPVPGMFHLHARGGARFRVRSMRAASNGLLSGDVDVLPKAVPAESDSSAVELLKRMIDRVGEDHFKKPLHYEDAAWVVYRLAELLPIEVSYKQIILEFDDAATLMADFKNIVLKQ